MSETRAPWQHGKPPNEQIVEVQDGDEIIRVMAFYGRDGWRPHWRSEDGDTMWDVSAFSRWRAVEPSQGADA